MWKNTNGEEIQHQVPRWVQSTFFLYIVIICLFWKLLTLSLLWNYRIILVPTTSPLLRYNVTCPNQFWLVPGVGLLLVGQYLQWIPGHHVVSVLAVVVPAYTLHTSAQSVTWPGETQSQSTWTSEWGKICRKEIYRIIVCLNKGHVRLCLHNLYFYLRLLLTMYTLYRPCADSPKELYKCT